MNLTWKDLVGAKEDRAKLIEDSASIENFNELAGELEEFLKDRLNVLGKKKKKKKFFTSLPSASLISPPSSSFLR